MFATLQVGVVKVVKGKPSHVVKVQVQRHPSRKGMHFPPPLIGGDIFPIPYRGDIFPIGGTYSQ